MSFELTVYNDRFKHERIDILEVYPDMIEGCSVFCRVNDSVCFDRIKDIHRLVMHLLLNTNYYFEIRNATTQRRGYFV